jgi:hypothetical protein
MSSCPRTQNGRGRSRRIRAGAPNGAPTISASMGPQEFADQLGTQFTGASRESLLAVANAVIGQDEPAYKAAMLDVVKQSMSVQLVGVENIVVKGDTATADVTLTQRVGDGPPENRTTSASLVRMDGQWLDCTPPAQP